LKGSQHSLAFDPGHQLPDFVCRIKDDVRLAPEALEGVDPFLSPILDEEVLPVNLGQS